MKKSEKNTLNEDKRLLKITLTSNRTMLIPEYLIAKYIPADEIELGIARAKQREHTEKESETI